jgi:hypothetical protein
MGVKKEEVEEEEKKKKRKKGGEGGRERGSYISLSNGSAINNRES